VGEGEITPEHKKFLQEMVETLAKMYLTLSEEKILIGEEEIDFSRKFSKKPNN